MSRTPHPRTTTQHTRRSLTRLCLRRTSVSCTASCASCCRRGCRSLRTQVRVCVWGGWGRMGATALKLWSNSLKTLQRQPQFLAATAPKASQKMTDFEFAELTAFGAAALKPWTASQSPGCLPGWLLGPSNSGHAEGCCSAACRPVVFSLVSLHRPNGLLSHPLCHTLYSLFCPLPRNKTPTHRRA